MSKAKQSDGALRRKQRAEDRYLRLAYVSATEKVVQKKEDGEWGDAHMLETANGDAFDCSCPDRRMNHNKCYHMMAWDDWQFNQIVLADGQVIDL